MGYAGSIGVWPTSGPPAPSGFTRMLSVSARPSAIGIGTAPCGPMSPGSVCPGSGRASSRWPRASIRATCAHAISRCITSSPMPPGTMAPSCARPRPRRRAAGVPDAIEFRPKWQIALEQVAQIAAEGVPAAPVVADAGYGVVTAFREALTAQAIPYVVGISTETTVWAPGRAPLPPPKYRGHGRPPTLVRRTGRHRPLSVRALAQHLPARAWRTVTWRAGTRGAMRSRFAAVRVRPAHRDDWRSTPRLEEWLLIEWPRGEAAPIKYWLSTLPPTAASIDLVRFAMLRWRIERDYPELKDELGLDHFEGRGWRGFHHHASLCIAAYAFLAAERLTHFPPESLAFLPAPRLPKRFIPRGAPRAS